MNPGVLRRSSEVGRTIYCWSGGIRLVAWHVPPAALAPGSVDLLALSRYRVLMRDAVVMEMMMC